MSYTVFMSDFERENRVVLSKVTNALVRVSEEELQTKSIYDIIEGIVEGVKKEVLDNMDKQKQKGELL